MAIVRRAVAGCVVVRYARSPRRRFREATARPLPPIRLHDGRHTAASLALEARVDVKVVSDQLGHATTKITMDLYQHVSRKHDAAERIVELLPTGERATGIERS